MINLCFINFVQEAVDGQNSSTTCEDHFLIESNPLGWKRSNLSSNFLNVKQEDTVFNVSALSIRWTGENCCV